MLGVLLPGESLGSTWNKFHYGMQYGDFFFFKGHQFASIFLWWTKKLSQNMNIQAKTSARLIVLFL